MEKTILTLALCLLGIFMLCLMIKVVKGPRFTDRVLAINAINTMITAAICLLSRYLGVAYLLDVALIYALLGFLDREKAGRVKRLLGFTSSYPRADDYLDKQAMAPYIRQAQADIRAAREKADVVIFYPHTGGQFNPLPGAKSVYIVEKALQAGADAVMASHAHMVQKAELNKGRPCVYSLGNFNMDPHSSIMVNKYLPEYGLAVHLYVDGGKIEKTTFSITKAVRGKTGQICAWPVDELHKTLSEKEQALLEVDVRQIYKMVNCKDLIETVIRREYDLDNEAWIDE